MTWASFKLTLREQILRSVQQVRSVMGLKTEIRMTGSAFFQWTSGEGV